MSEESSAPDHRDGGDGFVLDETDGGVTDRAMDAVLDSRREVRTVPREDAEEAILEFADGSTKTLGIA